MRVTGNIVNIIASTGEDEAEYKDLEIAVSSITPLIEDESLEINTNKSIELDTGTKKGILDFQKAHTSSHNGKTYVIVYYTFENQGNVAATPPIEEFFLAQNYTYLEGSCDYEPSPNIEKNALESTETTSTGETNLYYRAFESLEGKVTDEPFTIYVSNDDFEIIFAYDMSLDA